MARNINGGSDQAIFGASTTIPLEGGATPVTFAIRFKTSQTTANTIIAARWTTSSRSGWALVMNNTAGKLLFTAYNGTTNQINITGSATINDGNWHTAVLLIAHNAGLTSSVYTDAALDASGNNAGSWNGNSDLYLGWGALGFWGSYVGDVADAAFWDGVHLNTDEIAAYNKGISPALIRPAALSFYAPLVRDVADRIEASAVTLVGSTTVSDHPRVIGSLV